MITRTVKYIVVLQDIVHCGREDIMSLVIFFLHVWPYLRDTAVIPIADTLLIDTPDPIRITGRPSIALLQSAAEILGRHIDLTLFYFALILMLTKRKLH